MAFPCACELNNGRFSARSGVGILDGCRFEVSFNRFGGGDESRTHLGTDRWSLERHFIAGSWRHGEVGCVHGCKSNNKQG